MGIFFLSYCLGFVKFMFFLSFFLCGCVAMLPGKGVCGVTGKCCLDNGQTGRHITRQRDQRYGNRQVEGATVMCRNVGVLLCCCFLCVLF